MKKVVFGSDYAEAMRRRWRQQTKPSGKIYRRKQKHYRRDYHV